MTLIGRVSAALLIVVGPAFAQGAFILDQQDPTAQASPAYGPGPSVQNSKT